MIEKDLELDYREEEKICVIHRKVRLMKPTHDSLLLRVSCLRTHQTVFNCVLHIYLTGSLSL